MPEHEDILGQALQENGKYPTEFVRAVMPIIVDVASIDFILNKLSEKMRRAVVRCMVDRYGPHLGAPHQFDWGLPAGSWTDETDRIRVHEAWVHHAQRTGIPAIHSWLKLHRELLAELGAGSGSPSSDPPAGRDPGSTGKDASEKKIP